MAPDLTPSWTADFVYLKPGERERYLRFIEASWVQACVAALSLLTE